VRAGVAAVGVFSLLFNVPRWMESTLVSEPIANTTRVSHRLQRTELGNSFAYQLIYFDALYYIFMIVLRDA